MQNVIQGAAEKNGPLNFFAVFSATVWDFNTKFYSCAASCIRCADGNCFNCFKGTI